MYCLHCGDCCKRMSPITGNGDPCPDLIEEGSFVFCGRYKSRPIECECHDFPSRFCPIGLDILGISDIEKIRQRLESGYELIKGIVPPQRV